MQIEKQYSVGIFSELIFSATDYNIHVVVIQTTDYNIHVVVRTYKHSLNKGFMCNGSWHYKR